MELTLSSYSGRGLRLQEGVPELSGVTRGHNSPVLVIMCPGENEKIQVDGSGTESKIKPEIGRSGDMFLLGANSKMDWRSQGSRL